MIPFSMVYVSSRRHEGSEAHEGHYASALATEAQTLSIVAAGLNGCAPVAMLDVPADSIAETMLERMARRPLEFQSDLRRINCVASIVPRPIRHKRL
jgi:hypothetical protein